MIVTKKKIRAKKVTGEQITEAARKYIGAPYLPQGRDSIYGFDCGGLLLVVCRDLKVNDLEVLGYSPNPDGESFERILGENLKEIEKDKIQIGDIIACDYGKGIQHTAFVSQIEPYIRVIHAKRKFGVCEQRLFGTDDAKGWVKTYRIKTTK